MPNPNESPAHEGGPEDVGAVDAQAEAARLAGWNPADGPAPRTHHLPPAIDPALGHNGIAPTPGRAYLLGPSSIGMHVDVYAALDALKKWAGWREGANNDNPFGPWQATWLVGQAYCESFADGQLNRETGYDHTIGLTVSHTQFGAKGDAYTPWGVDHAKERGEWVQDEASQGRPCDLLPGDQPFFAWNNGAGPDPDHVETVVAVYDDGTFDTVGANTGSPNGVWCPIRRDRTYLLGRRRPQLYDAPAPAPTPLPQENEMTPVYMPVPAGKNLIPVAGGPIKSCAVTYASAGVTVNSATAQPGGRQLRDIGEMGIASAKVFSGRNYDELVAGEESIELDIASDGVLWLKIEPVT